MDAIRKGGEDAIIEENNSELSSLRCEESIPRKFMMSIMFIQFLGVTATAFGYMSFLTWYWDGFNKSQTRGLDILELGWPIILAYIAALVSFLIADSVRTLREVFCWIFWGIFLLDTALLGVLVWLTGGPSMSVFTPVFLLIPTVASCYCHPRKRAFWYILASVIIVFVAVSLLEFSNILNTSTERIIQSSSGSSEDELLIVNLFTVLCIVTAAICYWKTHKIRSDYCSECKRKDGEKKNICDDLYL